MRQQTEKKYFAIFLLVVSGLFLFTGSFAYASNLRVSNVTLGSRDPGQDKVSVTFDISWDHAWRTKINHDAVWVTVRLSETGQTPSHSRLCPVADNSVPDAGSNPDLKMIVPDDRSGIFLRKESFGQAPNISSEGVTVSVDYGACGFTAENDVRASVFGIEMVFVPQGAFYTGDYAGSAAAFQEGSADSDPWHISGKSSITTGSQSVNGYYYVSAGHEDEFTTGAGFQIPAAFPKGFSPFYVMKYEITEGQWVTFVNSLPSHEARLARDITNNEHKATDTVARRNTISCAGTPLVCSTSRPHRAVSYLNWTDLAAFLDWTALRPMTELEYEKAARGPELPVSGQFAWGTADIDQLLALSAGEEDGSELPVAEESNAHYDSVLLTGGDASQGEDYQQGPVRSGLFARTTSGRVESGAGYYGVMELSGNIKEIVVSAGSPEGLKFQGTHGDGKLTTETGYEGSADTVSWPGLADIPSRGVISAAGTGTRGGSWKSTSEFLRISDRSEAARPVSAALDETGGRGARTATGNNL